MSQERASRQGGAQIEWQRFVSHMQRTSPGAPSLALSDKQREIINAALGLLHVTSLDELSLRDIAKVVHMQAPALYWHFKNKAVLIDFMAEVMLQKEFGTMQARLPDEPWETWLSRQMLLLRKAMIAYPDGGRVVAGAHPYAAITVSKFFEYSLESLHSAGLSLEVASITVSTLMRYAFGYVIEEQSSPTTDDLKKLDISELMSQTPYTAALIRDTAVHNSEARYVAGINLVIAGVKATQHSKTPIFRKQK